MGSFEAEIRSTVGWAARDPSGILSPYTFTLRNTGPDDVYIKVLYCGICHTDLHKIKNDLGTSKYPMVPGHEVVGEVLEVGSDVKRFKVGEMVGVGYFVGSCKSCHACQSDVEQYCSKIICSYNDIYTDGKPTQGGFAQTMSGLRGGILGLGGVGHMGVKIAKAFGHKVTVISSSDKKKNEALEHLGADEYLVSSDGNSMHEAADSLDYIIDTVPVGHPLEPYLSLLKLDGKLILMGPITTPLQFFSPTVMGGRKSITGSMVGSIKEAQEFLEFWKEKGLSSMIEVEFETSVFQGPNWVSSNDRSSKLTISDRDKDYHV
ncbi:unnamed protein product [Lupinus luteus]|uniref:Enoyl reductase (ER) domain-containing protein n=1 Tax=Lupinus luteus TaxID=3873 RepID=A0AAV1X460_LUPLU